MDRYKSCEQEWYIIFSQGTYLNWLLKRFEPGFTHVMAMQLSEFGQFWIVVNPRATFTEVKLIPATMYPYPRDYCGPDCKIVKVRAIMSANRPRGGPCWFNCVEVVKSLIGLKSFKTITPYQLYKKLVE